MSAMGYEELGFGLLHEVIKGDVLEYLGQGKRCLEQDKKVLIVGFGPSLERGKEDGAKCLERAKENEAKCLERDNDTRGQRMPRRFCSFECP